MAPPEPNPAAAPDWFDPLNIAVTTTSEVLEGTLPVLVVIRDPGPGGWQFLDGESTEGREPVAISKMDLLKLDPTLAEVTDLPIGWSAERDRVGGTWRRFESPADGQDQLEAGQELSHEADQFLAEAGEEYDQKQKAFEARWRFESITG